MRNEIMIREPDLYFESLHNELNNFLRDTMLAPMFSNPLTLKKEAVWRPSIEVKQTEHEYKVKVQLPGVKKEDIDIELDNEFMTVTAEIEEEKEEKEEKEKNEKYHTCEFRYGKYKRTISFDQPIKQDEAKAEYKNGVLKIIIPKQHAENIKQAKRLEIE
ncbi:TPA: hypothetical protein CPT80_02140 [Candidatus Gastranaerophilales bacterium HUM_9]|nr:MAG TPA: hypothetical protein CPT80_02140 [Candidatus Gastranaerophilales bacterium HUM_9]HBX34266.1 hypothetical protein [Cyanobacteria bacterium UBA11440]